MFRHFVLASSLLLAWSGCLMKPKPISTAAHVFRFDSDGFRACAVHLGWSADELRHQCGEPFRSVPNNAYPGEQCFVYKSLAHSPATSSATAPYFVVCLGHEEIRSWVQAGKGRGKSMVKAELVVQAVYGLRGLPESIEPKPKPACPAVQSAPPVMQPVVPAPATGP